MLIKRRRFPWQLLLGLWAVAQKFSHPQQWALAARTDAEEERFIGWKGETYNVNELLLSSAGEVEEGRPWIEQIAWKPRAYIFHNLISRDEARHLVELAAPQMRRSTVVGPGGKSVEDNYRTSYGTFLRRYQDAVVEAVENRAAAWSQIPVAHQEDIQVLRYAIGQYYKPHSDTLRDDEAGVRVATVLIYLNEPERGGETAFPSSTWINEETKQRYSHNMSECATGHVAFKPKRGDALLFWSVNPDGNTEDPHALHTGCAVEAGIKWTVTKWIHAKPFRPSEMIHPKRSTRQPAHQDPGICEDTSPQCSTWVQNNGCEQNREYLVVDVGGLGVCRKSCKACTPCAKGDDECYNENRRQAGYLVFNKSELNL